MTSSSDVPVDRFVPVGTAVMQTTFEMLAVDRLPDGARILRLRLDGLPIGYRVPLTAETARHLGLLLADDTYHASCAATGHGAHGEVTAKPCVAVSSSTLAAPHPPD